MQKKLAAAYLAVLICASAQTYEQKIASAMERVDRVAAKGPFHPDWKSLESYQAPEWYQDAKFGIFIHWGVYSVPAFGNEWYPRNMYISGSPAFKHHVETYGPQSKFGYKDFIPQMKAEHFDATHWAEVFRKSGAKYVVPVAEHHDGFPMYDCSFTDWSAAKMGPKRDVIGELAAAVRKQGIHFAASSHRAEHWWFYDHGMEFDSDVKDPRYAGLYGPARPEKGPQPDKAYLDDWLARTTEIVDKYQPELIWFDWWIEQPVFQPYLQKFAAYYYNRGAEWKKGVAINYKKASFPEHAAVLDIERGKLDTLRPIFWQTDTSVCKRSWGYVQNHDYRSVDSIVGDLVDIVSKNGALLLNIGPRPDGTIPEPQEKMLLDIGRWLAVNGEAIYGTRPWKIYGEGPTQVVGGSFKDTASKPFTGEDIRFTTKGDALYAIALAWPETGRLVIKSIADRPVKTVRLLGSKSELKWSRTADGLTVELPAQKPCDYAFAFEIR
jgi:alpha-L-fucosidase